MNLNTARSPPTDPAPERTDVPGWFGKIAPLGDFASRRLPLEFTRSCDEWLSRCVDVSRAQWGDGWLDVYLTSPLWRFAWAPGVVDANWWFGVLMPSVDKVGRYFPLLVAKSCGHAPQESTAIDLLEKWFDVVAHASLATLRPSSTLEGFESDLAAAPVLHPPATGSEARRSELADRTSHEIEGALTLAQWMNRLALEETLRRFRGCSLWWPMQREAVADRLSVAAGLPAPESFGQMLEGSW